jgi:hypothetical protein
MRAVFKLKNHCSTCAVLVLVPVFHIVFPFCELGPPHTCSLAVVVARSAPPTLKLHTLRLVPSSSHLGSSCCRGARRNETRRADGLVLAQLSSAGPVIAVPTANSKRK